MIHHFSIPKEEPKQETLTRDYSNRSCQTCNLGQEGHCELELESDCASYANDETLGDFWINTFINDLNQVVSEIRNIKLNKLNI